MIETLLRLNIPYTTSPDWLPHEQGVYRTTLTKLDDYDSYYSQWNQATYNTERLLVGSVFVNLEQYARKSSLADCEGDDKSFFWNNSTQTLYIHFEFDIIPKTASITVTNQGGYSFIGTAESIYIDDVEYQPRIRTMPNIKKKVDAFQVGKMTFQDQSITLNNGDGALDTFIQNPIPGAEGSIVLFDTEDSSELTYYTGIVTSDKSTYDTYTIKLEDKRRRENVKIPQTRFDATTYPNIEDKYVGKIIPEGYGVLKGIKCYPTNGEVGSGNIQFRYATDATTLTEVRVKEDDVWSVVSTASSTPASGVFELTYANATNASGAVLECVADVTLRATDNPGDMISDMNSRYNSIEFDSSSYDLTEWATEKAKLADISLYMDKDKEFFKWIEDIQNGSDLFFVYDIDGDGKRSLRVNDPNRAIARAIDFYEIKDDLKDIERDFSEFSSTVTVLYNKNHQSNVESRIFVDTYEDAVLSKYRFSNNSEFPSLLPSQSDAETKADVIAEDQQEARQVIDVILHEQDLSNLVLKLYDVVTVDTSTPVSGYYLDTVPPDTMYADYGGSDSMDADYTGSDSMTTAISSTEFVTTSSGREYWGIIRGQILGIGYNPTDLSYTLTARERPESGVI